MMQNVIFTYILLALGLSYQLMAPAVSATEFTLFSLNLHGYHPYKESRRYQLNANGKRTSLNSHLFYFSPTELTRGHQKRVQELANTIQTIAPDLAFFQEVGAGSWEIPKTCDDFYRNFEQDHPYENAVLRVARKLKANKHNYQPLLACRGNLGWYTNHNTFNGLTIVDQASQTVYRSGDNPYPHGVLIEGQAILISERFRPWEHGGWNIQFNKLGHQLFVQFALVEHKATQKLFMLLNLHAGHKIHHFEQAIAIQKQVYNYLQTRQIPRHQLAGIIAGGDFNAFLYRHKKDIDASMLAWEMQVPGIVDFSDMAQPDQQNQLKTLLTSMNQSHYKRWASINDPTEAKQRIDIAVENLAQLQRTIQSFPYLPLKDAMDTARREQKCIQYPQWNSFCHDRSTIDFFLISPSLQVESATMLFKMNNYASLDGLTDHPGVLATLSF